MDDKILVTEPFIPPVEELMPYLKEIWENKILTNQGPMHQRLEAELVNFLRVKNLTLFSNGTLALIAALKALNVKGEVITTPFSFVATTNAIIWANCTPKFVDIDKNNFNLDPNKIEQALTSKTTAILAVHCYGNPCDVDAIDKIAKRNNLKVIYDAAHAFGANCHCGELLSHGDCSVLSFHATKKFNTFEGGAICFRDDKLKEKIDQIKNFGILDETTTVYPGFNAKLNEISSAFGLLHLKYMDRITARRKEISDLYRLKLSNIPGISMIDPKFEGIDSYSYFPVLINDGFPISRDQLYFELRRKNIFCRRYFYPLITNFEIYHDYDSSRKEYLPNANLIAQQILCLPIHPNLEKIQQERVINSIKSICHNL